VVGDHLQPGTVNMPAISPTWTDERVELLKNHFAAGLSCREIAADIGVSRNAVIGKLSRLDLTRRTDRDERRAKRKSFERARGRKASPRQQYEMLAAIYGEQEAPPPDEPISAANRCSLLELNELKCRWPIGTPGGEDFCFCGNASLDGRPYCLGHARLAYRPNSRERITRA
jgi:GcrA cell cycle regulator